MAIWNSRPGVTPVKRFKNSNAAANRIWARIQGLGEAATPEVEFAKPTGMAYYDSYTAQAAQAALGRSLAAFYTQDDDPTVNGSADANFLASLIKTHIDSIRTTVLAAYSGAKFKPLWP
jgi:hypothetical protein